MASYSHISIAIPSMDELYNLPSLLERLRRQTFQTFSIYICVNQPEDFSACFHDSWEYNIYINNQTSLKLLNAVDDLPLYIIDRSSIGQGWSGKKKGVGWARKVLFEAILQQCDDNELIVSMDADTDFDDDYFERLLATINQHPSASALCVPYYHPRCGEDATDRAMLRYECYMRHYLINLLEIQSPYAFSALGSAMAFPAWAYKRVGGITPLQGGEDFYLMQKFAKTGTIVRDIDTCVHPQGRISHRVPFGTGPAIARGIANQEESYPFFAAEGFQHIKQTTDLFPKLYTQDIETPLSDFLRNQLNTNDLWGSLRKNFKRQDLFVHACHERLDGLRILQYLKLLSKFETQIPDFATEPISHLNAYRDELFQKELLLRKDTSNF
ncbi:MAG: hypothetical protein KBT45_06755 [Bacteroidales bacterium]|nr:hypothetical protein [Candidatus Colimorpha pelethequi]